MNYLIINKKKLLLILVVLVIAFQIYNFFVVRITNLNLPKGKVVFVSRLRGDNEIYLMNLNGTNLIRKSSYSLFGGRVDAWISDLRPSFSYDGKKIVFESDRDDKGPRFKKTYHAGEIIETEDLAGFQEIYETRSDREEITRLTYNQSLHFDPIFSPDGSKILFRSVPSHVDPFDEELRIINSDGTGEKILIKGRGVALSAKFSPDRQRVFFVLKGDLYSIDTYGANLTKLTNFNARNIEKPMDIEGQPFVDEFALSPDGKQITLVATERKAYEFVFYSMNSDGTDLKRIALLPNSGKLLYVAMVTNLKYSPDGQKLIFVTNFDGKTLYTLDKNNNFKYVRNFHRVDLEDADFTFTPDSKHVIFVLSFPYDLFNDTFTWFKSVGYEIFLRIKYYIFRRLGGIYDNNYLCIMNLDTGNFRRITRLPISSSFGQDFIHWER